MLMGISNRMNVGWLAILAAIFLSSLQDSFFSFASTTSEAMFQKYVIENYGTPDHGWRRASGQILDYPFAADERSLRNGSELYQKHCSLCHGDAGKGDGSHAKNLSKMPANLQDVVKRRNEYHIFLQISGGRDEMPAGSSYLSERDRWDIVNYIENFKVTSL